MSRRGRRGNGGATYGGRWQVVRRLGGGGQAVTLLVRDLRKGGEDCYALKLFHHSARFHRVRQEIAAVGKVPHRNVVEILEASLGSRQPYYVMPHYEGGSLLDHPEKWLGDPVGALLFLAEVCDGVAAAHECGITHRDIKPGNILIAADGRPIVADFGICFLKEEERDTRTHEVVGARGFTAPELELGRYDDVDARADVYSLGHLSYWLLRGGERLPREDFRVHEWDLVEVLHDGRYRHVNDLFAKTITRSPSARLPNAAAFALELRAIGELFAAQEPTTLRVVSGDGQSARCGMALDAPLVVRVEDAEGRGIADTTVWWEGDGRCEPQRTTTDRDGSASARWHLAGPAGSQQMRATLGGLPPAEFTATSLSGPPSWISVLEGYRFEKRAGESFTITTLVIDSCSNPVENPGHTWTIMPDGETLASTGLSIRPLGNEGLQPGEHRYRVTVGPKSGKQSAYILHGANKHPQIEIQAQETPD